MMVLAMTMMVDLEKMSDVRLTTVDVSFCIFFVSFRNPINGQNLSTFTKLRDASYLVIYK